jgi:heme exporter protein D
MTWISLEEFIAMGGYGAYVWGSVLVTAGALALELVLLTRRKRSALLAAAQSSRRRQA